MTKFEAWVDILNSEMKYVKDKDTKNFLKYFRKHEMQRYLNYLRKKEGYRKVINYE